MPTTALNYMGRVTGDTRRKAEEILTAAEAAGHRINHVWGKDPNPGNPEHHSGRAVDFMVRKSRAAGDFIADYVWAHRKRLRLIHVIWRQRILSVERANEGWRRMLDRGSVTNNHYDHPHVLFADGYDPPPPSESDETLWIGEQLVRHGFDRHYKVGPSRYWGPADEANLRDFHMIRMGRYDDLGKVDEPTKAELGKPLFVSSRRHGLILHTPVDVRLVKFAMLKLGVAPAGARDHPGWWNSNLSGDLGRWYAEGQLNYQNMLGDTAVGGGLGPMQYARLGRDSGLFVGIT